MEKIGGAQHPEVGPANQLLPLPIQSLLPTADRPFTSRQEALGGRGEQEEAERGRGILRGGAGQVL